MPRLKSEGRVCAGRQFSGHPFTPLDQAIHYQHIRDPGQRQFGDNRTRRATRPQHQCACLSDPRRRLCARRTGTLCHVFTAPMIPASGAVSSRYWITETLCGMVRLTPCIPNARTPKMALPKSSGFTSKVSKAASCITPVGFSATGWPRHATSQLRLEICRHAIYHTVGRAIGKAACSPHDCPQ
jgi:hypothetical protein